MPSVELADGTEIFYREDNFTDPWRTDVATVVMNHGFCRNSLFWYAWVPTLARHFRVIRWDARGVGNSTKPEKGFPWSLSQYGADLKEFLDQLGIDRAFFVGESMGGMALPYVTNAMPDRVAAFVACASHLGIRGQVGHDMSLGTGDMGGAIRQSRTIEEYIRATEAGRLALDETSPAMRDWFCAAWAATPRQTWEEWSSVLVPQVNLTPEIFSKIKAPVLYIAASGSARASLDEAEAWIQHIPDARLAVVQTKSQAVAIVRPDECAALARDFFLEQTLTGAPTSRQNPAAQNL